MREIKSILLGLFPILNKPVYEDFITDITYIKTNKDVETALVNLWINKAINKELRYFLVEVLIANINSFIKEELDIKVVDNKLVIF